METEIQTLSTAGIVRMDDLLSFFQIILYICNKSEKLCIDLFTLLIINIL